MSIHLGWSHEGNNPFYTGYNFSLPWKGTENAIKRRRNIVFFVSSKSQEHNGHNYFWFIYPHSSVSKGYQDNFKRWRAILRCFNKTLRSACRSMAGPSIKNIWSHLSWWQRGVMLALIRFVEGGLKKDLTLAKTIAWLPKAPSIGR